MTETGERPAQRSGVYRIGGDLPVHRLGFGAMRITGPGVWGEPADRDEAIRVLKRAVELGIDLIDTADSYGPYVSEDLIAEALHPYPDELVIATKGGFVRTAPGKWVPVGRPEYLRQCVEMSLRRLKLERIDLYQLHRIDPKVPPADQLGELRALQDEGKIRHIGLSEVTVDEIKAAREHAPIASVQNLYNLTERKSQDVLEYCEAEDIAFIPWFPLATGELAKPGSVVADVASRHGATPAQAALAWLLHRSPVMLPIPGTSKVAHLEDNVAAAAISLSPEEVAEFEKLSG
ncbi:oxidoreductase [Actinomadura sp. NBRC 104412]|uniref:aldo/keto reductase n=1 Tax=Actinomadura sp. NBRC 104412 TaxID=3032203 RepID=UPI0024A6018A|nr:aldo/keto reductase [Actinomadura sp. NBRC 104412]GLZ08772.1 oxidoreductase [Actinomadura sp. NBRC 104412]